jgi:hypothetical protein
VSEEEMEKREQEFYLWLTNPEDYLHGDTASVYVSDHEGMTSSGWLLLKKPRIVVEYELPSVDEVRGKSIEHLKEMIEKVDAEAHRVKSGLEGKIANLLAIGYDEPKAVSTIDDDFPV